MAKNVFIRLRKYYESMAATLRASSESASAFANNGDVGQVREKAYQDFLERSVPYKCNVFLGGFLFDEDGAESDQLDVIVTADIVPRYCLPTAAGEKSFSPVEGALAVASVKSTLTKSELYNALSGLASIPLTRSLEGVVNPNLKIPSYADWPVKILYASAQGLEPITLLGHVNRFYEENPNIPVCRRVDFIHVNGSCFILKVQPGMSTTDKASGQSMPLAVGTYHLVTIEPDLNAIIWILDKIQVNAAASTHILFNYGWILNKIHHVHP